VPRHQSKTVHQQFGAVCGNVDFSITSHSYNIRHGEHTLITPVATCPPPSTPRASNDPELRDFLKNMAESMEVLRKQNEELNTRLTAAEAWSSQKERERAERREKERQDRIHRGKRPVNPHQEDNESTVQGENEMNRDKSRRVETENGGSRRDRSRREKSPREGSRRDRREGGKSREGEKSHQSRSHRDKSRHDESRRSRNETKMKDLEKKYARILRQIDGEDPELTAWDMLEDENLPFTERVKAYPMPEQIQNATN
jgi:hypothetical protein